MKRRRNKPAMPSAAESATPEEIRAFALFLTPLYEEEWHNELISDRPNWMYLTILHRRLRELHETCQ